MKQKKKKSFSILMQYAEGHKYFTYASIILAAASAIIALVPFYKIWQIIKEILEVRPDYSEAVNISRYGWEAVGFAWLGMIIYIAALMCSHKAAFRVQANMRISMMKHIMKLPLGYVDSEGTGKIRKIVIDSSVATETFLAHNLPDKAVSYATPVGLLAMMMIFDWKLGLICLIPAVIAFVLMGTLMMGPKMAENMKQYQNALEAMSSEAVEYVRGIPVVKTFGQTIYTLKRFKAAIDEYEKRLSRYCKLKIVEVADEKTPDHASELQNQQIKDREGERLLKQIKDGSFVIALAIQGKKMDSIAFSEKIDALGLHGVSDIGFVIGGSLGLSDAVLSRADLLLSFSDMTFPHQLMRVILLEQVYRAYRISCKEPYHK